MAKTSWDYFLEQKERLERQQFRDNIMMEVEFSLKAFKEQMRTELLAELDQRVRQQVEYQERNQKVEVKIDADQIAKDLQKALRF